MTVLPHTRTSTAAAAVLDPAGPRPPVAARAVDVSRSYGRVVALDHVSIEFGRGELVGLLGPNGAGKSTLLHLMTGLRTPDGGRVEVFGGDPREARTRLRIGVTPQETGLPDTLKVREVVDFVAKHYPEPEPRATILDRYGIADLSERRTGGLSGGQKRRLAVALAFVGRPDLVFLDEPTTGLDVDARHQVWEQVGAFHAAGGTVLLTTHYLEEVEALAERVVVLSQGAVVADGSVPEIRGLVAVAQVSMLAPVLPVLAGVVRSESKAGRHTLFTTDPDQLIRDLVTAGTAFSHLEVRQSSLEDAFLSLA
jgi:ABC-2 type transport system ATP-binding protein